GGCPVQPIRRRQVSDGLPPLPSPNRLVEDGESGFRQRTTPCLRGIDRIRSPGTRAGGSLGQHGQHRGRGASECVYSKTKYSMAEATDASNQAIPASTWRAMVALSGFSKAR